MRSPKIYTVEEATVAAANYCVYQERCHMEVENKLRAMNIIPEAREKILLYLIENNFLNEERFSQSFARGKFLVKKWGKQKIIKELKLRNISSYNIKSGLAEINDADYFQTLLDLGQKKWDQLNEPNLFKRRAKTINHLKYKGFEIDLVYKAITEIGGKF
jgi:regulatory protein